MKDQNQIPDGESKQDIWNRGLDIFIESVIKPDPALRQCAHNQLCYHELMDVRQDVLDYLKTSDGLIKPEDPQYSDHTSDDLYDRHHYKICQYFLMKQSLWITGRMLEWCGGIKRHDLSHVEVITPKKKSKGFR